MLCNRGRCGITALKRGSQNMTYRNAHAITPVASWTALTGTLALALLGGCGGQAAAPSEQVGTTSQPLEYTGASGDGDAPWRYWSQLCGQNFCPTDDVAHTMAPALCWTAAGYLAVSVDTNSQYRVLQFLSSQFGPSWDVYDSTSQWLTKPACALREDDAVGQPGILVAGKYLDNYIYVDPGTMAPIAVGTLQQNPIWNGYYDLVGGPYTKGGSPAMSSQINGFGTGAAVVTFMGDDARTIYAHAHILPYTQNSWQSRITGPVLPLGWAAVGAPAIASMGVGIFEIVVHAHHSTRPVQDALFQTYFFADDNANAFFSNSTGSPAKKWTQFGGTLAAGKFTINGDPALTLSTFGPMVYFRSGQQIYQTTDPLGSNPVLAMSGLMGDNVVASAPAATGSQTFDEGTNLYIARTVFGQIFYTESYPDGRLEP
jgi:hypothetical protein